MFLMTMLFLKIRIETIQSFNPLNQVYVFNHKFEKFISSQRNDRFNPLNQVYVFNNIAFAWENYAKAMCFNPLNQVYVFN